MRIDFEKLAATSSNIPVPSMFPQGQQAPQAAQAPKAPKAPQTPPGAGGDQAQQNQAQVQDPTLGSPTAATMNAYATAPQTQQVAPMFSQRAPMLYNPMYGAMARPGAVPGAPKGDANAK